MTYLISDGSPVQLPPLNRIDSIVGNTDAQRRFVEKLDKDQIGQGCWLWAGHRNDEGYGNFGVAGSTEKAHRVSYRFFTGPIPKGFVVCHRCDNPPCCNPAHLWLGTSRDNARDKYRKGRGNHARGDANGARLYPERLMRGDDNVSRKHPEKLVRGVHHWTAKRPHDVTRGTAVHTAKLDEATVITMRGLAAAGRSCPSLAKEFGVNNASAYFALTGRSWKNVPGALPTLPYRREWHSRGERVNTAKLTADDVREIRREYAEAKAKEPRTKISYVLAEKYGVSRGLIPQIVSRKCWAHIP